MSADTTPISPARFAAALKDLSVPMLHLKVLEIRNSIAHLQYSNDQLKPFAEGASTAVSSSSSATTASPTTDANAAGEPDQDCVDAIRENEQVIERMNERIALVRLEVEERGVSWAEFQSKEEVEAAVATAREEQAAAAAAAAAATAGAAEGMSNGDLSAAGNGASPWTDGTFQTGTIRNGEVHMDAVPGQSGSQARVNGGGSLSDEQLRAAMEERLRAMSTEDDEDGGMHL